MNAKQLIKHIETKCRLRLRELDEERKQIFKVVPSLAPVEKPRRKWSLKQREAASLRMKKMMRGRTKD